MNVFDNFVCGDDFKGYNVSKTVVNKLIPVGKTRENIARFNIIENDLQRKKESMLVKGYIDRMHKVFINETLRNIKIDWKELYKELDSLKLNKPKKEYKLCQEKYRKLISKCFVSDVKYKKLFNKELFLELLPSVCTKEELYYVNKFNNFYSYFTDFNTLRKNLYNSDEKHNQIAYRIVNENFPVYYKNCVLINSIKIDYKDLIEENVLSEMFNLNTNYRFPVSDEDINKYNILISGDYADSKCVCKGINQLIKEYNDKNKVNIPYLKKLKLNILSDKQPLFTVEEFISTQEVLSAVKEINNIYEAFCEAFSKIKLPENLEGIYISGKYLNKLSFINTGNYSVYQKSLSFCKIKPREYYSFSLINDCYYKYIQSLDEVPGKTTDIISYFGKLNAFKIMDLYSLINFNEIKDLQKNKEMVIPIKNYLSSVLEFYNLFRLVCVSDDFNDKKDEVYYTFIDEWINQLSLIVSLYNKTRNFVTKKIIKNKKLKLNFDCSTLLGGWDRTKEDVNNGFLFFDEECKKYYLGINNKIVSNKLDFIEKPDSSFKKLYVKNIKEPHKSLPHAFLSGSGIRNYNPTESLLENYKLKKHIKGESFDINFCHELIDYFKFCISKYENYKYFTFNFSKTEDYKDISEFYSEVSECGYNVELKGVDKSDLFNAVDSGNLFLFEIYNRHLSGKSHGIDIHTEYFKSIFTSDNNFIQLNGGAEIFYRPSCIEKSVTHAKGSFIVNKNTKSGLSLDKDIYKNIYENLNSGKPLNIEAKKLLDSGEIIYKVSDRELIKDNHYTEENITFCCPLKINYKAKDMLVKPFNDIVIESIKNNEVNILAVNRGEHNLISTVLIDKNGKILNKKNYNLMYNKNTAIDYKNKLYKREMERMASRLDWQEIDDIAKLKDGYLSLVVGEISKTMIENNAVLVLENLSSEFKQSRTLIESNIYSKFETKLFQKLSCLVFKNKEYNVPGGLYHPYQLVPAPNLHKENDLQFGWIFFMNPAYISKICTEESYINVFKFTDITNFNKRKEFLAAFDSIVKLPDDAGYEFKFKRNNFNKKFNGSDTLVCNGVWNVWNNIEKKIESVDVLDTLKKAFTLINCTEEKINYIDTIKKLEFTMIYNSGLELIIKCLKCCSDKKQYENNDIEYKGVSWDFIAAYNLALKMNYIIAKGMNLNKNNIVLNFKTEDFIEYYDNRKTANQ